MINFNWTTLKIITIFQLTRYSSKSYYLMDCVGISNMVIYKYPTKLQTCTLLTRYKRFLADVDFKNAENQIETVYCPNTGSMYMLIPPDNPSPLAACSIADSGSKRKYRYTMEMIKQSNAWVGIHSALANRMVENALNNGFIDECKGFTSLRREVEIKNLGFDEKSKIDFELTWGSDNSDNFHSKMILEVKSVTLAMDTKKTNNSNKSESIAYGINAEFPDCPSVRGQKHLKCLTAYVKKGGRAGILFLIQRDDCHSFSASDLDPLYGPLLHEAAVAGVLILPYHCRLDPEDGTVTLLGKLPFIDKFDSNVYDNKKVSSPFADSQSIISKEPVKDSVMIKEKEVKTREKRSRNVEESPKVIEGIMISKRSRKVKSEKDLS